MNLVIDIGNTSAKIAVMDENDIVCRRTVPRFTSEVLVGVLDDYPLIDKAIVSASGKDAARAYALVSGRVKCALLFDSSVPVPLKNGYGSPSTLGSDRLAAAVGASVLYGRRNMLIVDFGTAITYDIVCDGTFMGGNISLGLRSRLRALHEYTAHLPLCEPTDERLPFGTTTATAVEQGAMSGVEYETEGYIRHFGEKYDDLCIIFTGGDAKYFVKRIKNTIFANRDLIFFGLNAILEYNTNAERKDK
ncbi:MAG: type III pantothenate kinase [Alistipes sp.]|nr:type III pantothenate kinase [Alistipes sp.]